MRYKLTLYMSKFMKVGDDYQTVEVPKELTFDDKEDAHNVIDYMVDGSDSPVKFEIKKINEEA